MAYRINITDLDAGVVKCDQETETFLALIDQGENLACSAVISASLGTVAAMAAALYQEAERLTSKLPKPLRKEVRKEVKRNAKKANARKTEI